MPAGINLAETTIFIPEVALEAIADELKEAGLRVLPHPFSAEHHNLKDGSVVSGRMVDVDGLYSCLARTLSRTLAAYDLNQLNNPVIIFPFG